MLERCCGLLSHECHWMSQAWAEGEDAALERVECMRKMGERGRVVKRTMGDEPGTGGLRRKLCWAMPWEGKRWKHFTSRRRAGWW
jgi:hypothetical protein